MLRKTMTTLLAAAVAGAITTAAHADVNINLSLVVTQPGTVSDGSGDTFTGGTWAVYATLTGSTSSLGLAGIQVDVAGTGNVVVEDGTFGDGSLITNLDLPALSGPKSFGEGFNLQQSTGTSGIGIAGYQNTTAYKELSTTASGQTYTNLLLGVGQSAGSSTGNVNSWAFPVEVADGYYTGTLGTLSVVSNPLNDDALPATLPSPTVAGAGFTALSVDTVNGGPEDVAFGPTPTVITSVPEPASLGVLLLGALTLFAPKRRKA